MPIIKRRRQVVLSPEEIAAALAADYTARIVALEAQPQTIETRAAIAGYRALLARIEGAEQAAIAA
jgi:hypothetical protein